jgi:hypothetical protein
MLTKDAAQRLVIGSGQVARINVRGRYCTGWQAEFSHCKANLGPSLPVCSVCPEVGDQQGPRGGHEHREDGNKRYGQNVHEDQCTPYCN